MKLKPRSGRYAGVDVEFGYAFNAPGARGFFCENEYWYSWLWKLFLGYTWGGCSFVAKTMTLEPNVGNTPLRPDLHPKEWLPRSIKAYPKSGHIVNTVGLTNPGMDALLKKGVWQRRTDPIMLSFMPKGDFSSDMVLQAEEFVRRFQPHLGHFKGPVALHVNFACPNTGIDPATLYGMIGAVLQALRYLGIPLIVNLNALVPVKVLTTVEHLADAFWIANAIPWGSTPEIDWGYLEQGGLSALPRRFDEDPVTSTKKGGLSGPMCFHLTREKAREAREAGIRIPIIAGNGIQDAANVAELWHAGASGIAIGTVALLRPWRMREIIRAADERGRLYKWDMPFEDRKKKLRFDHDTREFVVQSSSP